MKVTYQFDNEIVYSIISGVFKKYWKHAPPTVGKYQLQEKQGKLTSLTFSTGDKWTIEKRNYKAFLSYEGSRYGFVTGDPFHGPSVYLGYSSTGEKIGLYTRSDYFEGKLIDYKTSTPPEWNVLPTEIVRKVDDLIIISWGVGPPSPWDTRIIRPKRRTEQYP